MSHIKVPPLRNCFLRQTHLIFVENNIVKTIEQGSKPVKSQSSISKNDFLIDGTLLYLHHNQKNFGNNNTELNGPSSRKITKKVRNVNFSSQ